MLCRRQRLVTDDLSPYGVEKFTLGVTSQRVSKVTQIPLVKAEGIKSARKASKLRIKSRRVSRFSYGISKGAHIA